MGQVLGDKVSGLAALTEDIGQRLSELNIGFGAPVPGKLARYHELLLSWNERMNLTGDLRSGDALDRHYVDSLSPLSLPGLFPEGASLADVGSGAGFPGLPLAIARPDMRVTLIDSLGKRVMFLREVITELELTNAVAVHARAEDAGRDAKYRERYDIATARALAPLPVLMEYLLPFARVGGVAVCYKGPAVTGELIKGARAAALLGGGELRVTDAPSPRHPDWRHCVVIARKTQKTVPQYPRKPGTPERSPLG